MSRAESPPVNHPDFTSLLQQAKVRYVIKDRSSDKILGYAIMNTDRSVTAEEIKLQCITWPGMEAQLLEGPGAEIPPSGSPSPDNGVLIPGTLAADLDLSHDSLDSMSNNVEEDLSPISCNDNEDSLAQIRTNKCQFVYSSISPSPPVLDSSTIPPSPALIQFTDSSSVSSHKSPVVLLTNPFYSAHTTKNLKQEAPRDFKTCTKSIASDIVDNGKDLAKSSQAAGWSNGYSVSCERRNVEDDIDEPKKKKVAANQQLGRPSRESISAFYEYVEEGKETKYRRVKCLLCNDGRLLLLDNFNRHIHSRHEPPAACENCGQVFSREQLRTHRKRKKCLWQKLEFEEKPASFSLEESKIGVEASPFPPPMERHQDEILDTCFVATDSREVSQTLQLDKGKPGGSREQSSATSSSTNQASQARKSGDWVFLTLAHHSLERYRSNFKIEKQSKVKKLMKAYYKEHRIINKKHLRFYIGSEELRGDEKIGELKLNRGKIDEMKKNVNLGEIEVFGEIV